MVVDEEGEDMEMDIGGTIWFAIETLSNCVDSSKFCDVWFLWRLGGCHFVVCKSRNEWCGWVDIITVTVGQEI